MLAKFCYVSILFITVMSPYFLAFTLQADIIDLGFVASVAVLEEKCHAANALKLAHPATTTTTMSAT